MTSANCRSACAVVVVAVALVGGAQPTQAGGNGAGNSFRRLGAHLPPVFVRDQSGRETIGRVRTFTEDTLVLDRGQTFDARQVVQIQQSGDGLRNGAVAGALLGAGLAYSAIDSCPHEAIGPPGPTRRFVEPRRCGWWRTAITLQLTGMGAAVGTAVDAMHTGRRVVWRKPSAGARRAASFEDLGQRLLPTVHVRDHSGHETTGHVVALDDQALVLDSRGEQVTFTPATVRRVQMGGDPVSDGARRGALVGAGLGVAMGIASAKTVGCGSSCAAGFLIGTTLVSGVSAAIGTALDALSGRTTLWEAPGRSARSVTVGLTGGQGLGARVGISW